MSDRFERPRFRYVVATPTREHGSALTDYDQTILDRGFHIRLTPQRKVHDLEWVAYSRGFQIWQRDILGRGDPDVRRIGPSTIAYNQEFTTDEIFAFVVDDSEERRHFLGRRRDAMVAGVAFLQRFARDRQCVDLEEWAARVAECLGTSLPFLFVDEAVHVATRIAVTSAFGPAAWNDLQTLLNSSYVRDVARRMTPPLPATKEWSLTPAAVPIPLAPYSYDSVGIDVALIRIRRAHSLTDHTMRFCRAAPLVHFMSEETHYVLGSLVLAGNHLTLASTPTTFRGGLIREDLKHGS